MKINMNVNHLKNTYSLRGFRSGMLQTQNCFPHFLLCHM